VLLAARHTRGAIDFETQETRIIFGDERKIAEIRPTVRNDAHKLIEECMLAANVATAEFLQKHGVPALYRVHDGPPPERLEKLRAFLGELGLSLHKGKDPSPKDYQALLASIAGRPDFHLIQTVMLRSLSQAVYSAENNGHFGLNYEAYTHFTSPIRRYPDLLVHRAIRSVIRSKVDTPHVKRAGAMSIPKARIYPYDENALEQLGEQCSMTERRADEATRDVVNWLKCEFMKDRVGETFPGVITAVTGFGLFVELTDIYVEGLVHVSACRATTTTSTRCITAWRASAPVAASAWATPSKSRSCASTWTSARSTSRCPKRPSARRSAASARRAAEPAAQQPPPAKRKPRPSRAAARAKPPKPTSRKTPCSVTPKCAKAAR
jgi:ribonuclease R